MLINFTFYLLFLLSKDIVLLQCRHSLISFTIPLLSLMNDIKGLLHQTDALFNILERVGAGWQDQLSQNRKWSQLQWERERENMQRKKNWAHDRQRNYSSKLKDMDPGNLIHITSTVTPARKLIFMDICSKHLDAMQKQLFINIL